MVQKSAAFALAFTLLVGCSNSPSPPQTSAVLEDRPQKFEITILKPANQAEIVIGQTFSCIIRARNLSGGQPTVVGVVTLEKGRTVMVSGALKSDKAVDVGARQQEFVAELKLLPNARPGSYLIKVECWSPSAMLAAASKPKSAVSVPRFTAPPITVIAKKAK